MNDEAVSNLLKQLHGKLEGATSISTEDRALLEQLSADIQAILARQAGPQPAGLADRVEAAVTRFEVSHPELTATLMQVSKTLGDMGI
jgi:hypothetical protein